VGTDTFPVRVSEIVGPERDRVHEEQAHRYPGAGEYAEKTAAIRTTPGSRYVASDAACSKETLTGTQWRTAMVPQRTKKPSNCSAVMVAPITT
jgi:hypothetical protein